MSQAARKPARASRRIDPHGYWAISQQPLHALVFLLPLIVIYEIGTYIYLRDPASGQTHSIVARTLLRQMFEVVGVAGYYLPGLLVVAVLLGWHFAQESPRHFRFRPQLYPTMWVESAALALPLFVFMLVLARHAPLAAAGAAPSSLEAQLLFSIGAGIYEELLFRLIAIALLHTIFFNVLKLSAMQSAALAIGISAIAFALYHFSPENPFRPGLFLQYTFAGVYLAMIYQLRGFGIVAAVHAIYDVMAITLPGTLLR